MKTNYAKSITIALLLGVSVTSQSQIINTITGNGYGSFTGNGGPASAAEINTPTGVVVDAVGNIYIADEGNNVVRKINTAGVISSFAGNTVGQYAGDGGQAATASLYEPQNLAVDAAGNVYIADEGNDRVRMVNTAGIITTLAGNGTTGYSGDGGHASSAELRYPTGVAVDAVGNVYITDGGNQRIRKVTSTGNITTFAGNGMPGYSGDGGQATTAELAGPHDIAVDASGDVYIADYGNYVIRKVKSTGVITTIAGDGNSGFSGDGNQASTSILSNPDGMVVDESGNLYFADYGNNRVREISTSGIINTIAGDGQQGFDGDGGLAKSAELYSPAGVGVDSRGNVYIADNGNNRIRKVYLNTSGINQPSSSVNEVSVYPVPNSGTFTITGMTVGQIIELYNSTGQLLSTIIADKTTIHFDISGHVNGIYLIRIQNKDGSTEAQRKIVKTE